MKKFFKIQEVCSNDNNYVAYVDVICALSKHHIDDPNSRSYVINIFDEKTKTQYAVCAKHQTSDNSDVNYLKEEELISNFAKVLIENKIMQVPNLAEDAYDEVPELDLCCEACYKCRIPNNLSDEYLDNFELLNYTELASFFDMLAACDYVIL